MIAGSGSDGYEEIIAGCRMVSQLDIAGGPCNETQDREGTPDQWLVATRPYN